MSDYLVADGSFQGLKELVDSGYTNMVGITYGCGCQLSRWYKDGRIVFEYSERCKDHTSKAGDTSGDVRAPQIGEVNNSKAAIKGTVSTDSEKG